MTPPTRNTLLGLALGCLVLTDVASAQAQPPTIQVTVTNVTAGQVLSPPVVIAHNESFSLFHPGMPASAELAMLAEDAMTGPLVAALNQDPNVHAVALGSGPIPPGGSATIAIQANGAFRYFTVAGMLVTTNDAFFAVQHLEATPGTVTMYADAYDAGSEENNEDCAFIPGPPCNNPGVRTTTSEGFVHIHPGIHGVGSLPANAFDWRNPTAKVSVSFSPAGR